MIWNESVWASRPLKEDTDLKKYPIYLQGVECCAKRETKCERRNKGKKEERFADGKVFAYKWNKKLCL